MAARTEQIDIGNTKSSFRKIKARIKRSTAKARRRAEKRDPQNVPPRSTAGWVS